MLDRMLPSAPPPFSPLPLHLYLFPLPRCRPLSVALIEMPLTGLPARGYYIYFSSIMHSPQPGIPLCVLRLIFLLPVKRFVGHPFRGDVPERWCWWVWVVVVVVVVVVAPLRAIPRRPGHVLPPEGVFAPRGGTKEPVAAPPFTAHSSLAENFSFLGFLLFHSILLFHFFQLFQNCLPLERAGRTQSLEASY